MGQRHQGFIKVKTADYKNGQKVIGSHTIGFHHQWLYGAVAMAQTRNILEFSFKASRYNAFNSDDNLMSNEEKEKLVCSLASINVKNGYYHNVISLNDEAKEYENSLNPSYQDNNDGQHFIDFTVKGKPKMCFAFPFEKEIWDNEKDEVVGNIPTFKVIGAREYFHTYYSQAEIDKATSKGDIDFFKKALRDIKWIENHTKLMTQDEFEVLYPHLKA